VPTLETPMSPGGSQASAGEGRSPCNIGIGIGYRWSWQLAPFRAHSLLQHAPTMVMSMILMQHLRWWRILNAKALFMPRSQPDPLAEHAASFGLRPASQSSLVTFWHMLRLRQKRPLYAHVDTGHKPLLCESGQKVGYHCLQ